MQLRCWRKRRSLKKLVPHMKSRALANSFKLAKLDFHFAAVLGWLQPGEIIINERHFFSCSAAACVISQSLALHVDQAGKNSISCPDTFRRRDSALRYWNIMNTLIEGFRSSSSSGNYDRHLKIVANDVSCHGWLQIVCYFNPSIVPPHVLIWAPSLGCHL